MEFKGTCPGCDVDTVFTSFLKMDWRDPRGRSYMPFHCENCGLIIVQEMTDHGIEIKPYMTSKTVMTS